MKVRRNEPCPCGSGKKYKHCCYAKDSVKHEAPEPEEVVTEDAASEDAVTEDGDGAQNKEATETPHSHQKDRSRFQGQSRSGSANFRAKARGSQRGN